jgi:hypothetical protein
MANAKRPTDRSHHINIQQFSLHELVSKGEVILRHKRGTINPADALTRDDIPLVSWEYVDPSTHDDFRGDTVVVHPTARPVENYRALQKGGARLVIHAMY